MRVEPRQDNYAVLYAHWQQNGGTTFTWGGFNWLVIKDNDKIVFVRTGSASGIDDRYGETSIARG